MESKTYRPPPDRSETPISVALGVVFAVGLFVVMALAQMMGAIDTPEGSLPETVVAFKAPDVVEMEDEEPPPLEQEEPEPELAQEPQQLSLAQLDIALNPGTGGSLVGDFSLPVIGTSAQELGTEDFVDFSDLDQMPRPVGAALEFPSRLRKKQVSGRVVLLVKLAEDGRVVDVQVDSSTLPEFNDVVANAVSDWRFTPPTQQGRPVKAQARLPIPINIK